MRCEFAEFYIGEFGKELKKMKMKGYNYLESAVLYCAVKSVGKSVPVFTYKIPKPENLMLMINDLKLEREK